MFENNKASNIRKVEYCIDCYEKFGERKLALALFDMLGFNQNIALHVFRAYSGSETIFKTFSENNQCTLIRDVTRPDCFCIFIPQIKSNLGLFDLISQMDVQTEWNYIPSVTNFEELLYSWKNMRAKSVVDYGFSTFEAIFDMDFGLHFHFDLSYYDSQKIENTLEQWEKTFGDVKFTKRSSKT